MNKKILFFVIVLVVCAGGGFYFLKNRSFFSQIFVPVKKDRVSSSVSTSDVFVTWVIDGDTIIVSDNGKKETVRLIGIDTPEFSEDGMSTECYAKEAKQVLEQLVKGKIIRITSDLTQSNRDVYERLLRYVYLLDETFVNQYMIEHGFAKEYTYMNNPYTYQQNFIASQTKAKEQKYGVWGTCSNAK